MSGPEQDSDIQVQEEPVAMAAGPRITREQAAALRAPFRPEQIGKLPRFSGGKDTTRRKGNCVECGKYHDLPAVHLDYVGHAAVTDRLLSVDPEWTWTPLAFDERGLPIIMEAPSLLKMWIRLTVCGVTRLGVGTCEPGKVDPDKQLIGDALRNAAMRFGVGLDLWSKEDLAVVEGPEHIGPDEAKVLAEALAGVDVELERVCEGYGVESLDQLSPAQATQVRGRIAELQGVDPETGEIVQGPTQLGHDDEALGTESVALTASQQALDPDGWGPTTAEPEPEPRPEPKRIEGEPIVADQIHAIVELSRRLDPSSPNKAITDRLLDYGVATVEALTGPEAVQMIMRMQNALKTQTKDKRSEGAAK